MKPEVAYLGAYAIVADEKIYDKEWFLLDEFIRENFTDNQNEVLNNVLDIIGDKTEKKPLNDIIVCIRACSDEEKKTAFSLCVKIVFCDDIYSLEDKVFINNLAEKISIDESFFKGVINESELHKSEYDTIETSDQKMGKKFYKFLASILPTNYSEKMMQRYRDCLLSGSGYVEAIGKMQKIANQDLDTVRRSFNGFVADIDSYIGKLNKDTSKIKLNLSKLASNNEDNTNNETVKILDDLESNIKTISSEIKVDIHKILSKKEDSIRNYTVSFMGRTKAGKSTLHSVILGGVNKEFIGKGQERTTRYNRVYQWNGIRVIDTPGIGAPGGKSDEEIAKSVVDESDLICYVVTSDSVQETEFNFFSKLKNQNKPVVVLLNKKENFARTNSMRERFLSDPLGWYKRTDKDSISGSITRIEEYVKKHISNIDLIIHPVQLLAAQLSLTEQNPSKKEKYYNGSRIQAFLDELRIQILDEGVLKRSQNILDGSIFYFSKYEKELFKFVDYCSKFKDQIDKQGKKALDKIQTEATKRYSSLKCGLENLYDAFEKDDIKRFAESHYSIVSGSRLASEFNDFVKSSGFENHIKNRIDKEAEQYKASVQNIMTEFSEHLNFAHSRFSFNLNDISNTKGIVKRIGDIITFIGGIIARIPGLSWVGLIIGAVGVIISWFARLFKSKETKIRERYESLVSQFSKQKEEQIVDILDNFDKVDKTVREEISSTFNTLSNSFGTLLNNIVPLHNKCAEYYDSLNEQFAKRIIDFALKTEDTNPYKLIVKREYGKKMTIIGVRKVGIDEDKLTKMLSEKIEIIENGNP